MKREKAANDKMAVSNFSTFIPLSKCNKFRVKFEIISVKNERNEKNYCTGNPSVEFNRF